MKITVTESMFLNQFSQVRPENFSRAALCALFEYLEDIDCEGENEIELDVIALCCEYTEYPSALAAAGQYGSDAEDEEGALEYLRDQTQVIVFDGGVIIQDF